VYSSATCGNVNKCNCCACSSSLDVSENQFCILKSYTGSRPENIQIEGWRIAKIPCSSSADCLQTEGMCAFVSSKFASSKHETKVFIFVLNNKSSFFGPRQHTPPGRDKMAAACLDQGSNFLVYFNGSSDINYCCPETGTRPPTFLENLPCILIGFGEGTLVSYCFTRSKTSDE
jgi:hypothetical protein